MAGSKVTDYTMFIDNDLLASTVGFEPISITIDKAAVDAGNTGKTKQLRAGLVLVPKTSTGKYVPFIPTASNPTDGEDASENVVVLFQPFEMDGTNDGVAVAVLKGTIKSHKVLGASGVDWSACQRLTLLKQTQSGY